MTSENVANIALAEPLLPLARRSAGAVFCVASMFTLTACGNGEVLQSDDSYVLVGSEGDGNNIAGVGIGGTVRTVGSCLGIGDLVVIWPYGTALVSDDPLEIDVPDLGHLKVGETLEGGGQSVDSDQLPDGVEVPADCQGSEVFVFYPDHP